MRDYKIFRYEQPISLKNYFFLLLLSLKVTEWTKTGTEKFDDE